MPSTSPRAPWRWCARLFEEAAGGPSRPRLGRTPSTYPRDCRLYLALAGSLEQARSHAAAARRCPHATASPSSSLPSHRSGRRRAIPQRREAHWDGVIGFSAAEGVMEYPDLEPGDLRVWDLPQASPATTRVFQARRKSGRSGLNIFHNSIGSTRFWKKCRIQAASFALSGTSS